MSNLSQLSDAQLLSEITKLAATHRRCISQLIEHLAELDARGSHLDLGHSSLFAYCVEALGFSEDEACRRIDAARIGRCFPAVFERIASGEVSLTVLAVLKPYLAKDNAEELLNLVARATVRTARERIAARFPQQDAPEMLRKLPTKAATTHANNESETGASRKTAPVPAATSASSTAAAHSSESEPPRQAAALGETPGRKESDDGRLHPLSQDRFVLRVTVQRKVRDDLEQARDLLRHKYPNGLLEDVIREALEY